MLKYNAVRVQRNLATRRSDITKPCYNGNNFPDPMDLVIMRIHCTIIIPNLTLACHAISVFQLKGERNTDHLPLVM